METGEALKTLEAEHPMPGMSGIEFCNEDRCAAMVCNGQLVIIDLDTGEALHEIDVPCDDEIAQGGAFYIRRI